MYFYFLFFSLTTLFYISRGVNISTIAMVNTRNRRNLNPENEAPLLDFNALENVPKLTKKSRKHSKTTSTIGDN